MSEHDHRDLAIFTIVQEEPEFVHAWVNHYKKCVSEPCDLYVLVHAPLRSAGEVEESHATLAWKAAEALLVSHHRVTLVPVHHRSSFDHLWLASTVSKFQTFLLQSYRWVLFAECDEFVFPTPRQGIEPETLLQFIASLDTNMPPAVRATGFEVVQQMDEQPLPPELYKDGNNVELTAGRMVEDCHLWYRSRLYSKTLLANVPAEWRVGFHRIDGAASAIGSGAPSPSLTLVHLHKVDFALALTRSRRSRARQWPKIDIEKERGWQNRIEHEDELRNFWQQDIDTREPMQSGRLKLIPPHIKDALR